MKKYGILLAGIIFATLAFAQKPVISFEEKVFDFGKVKEENGKITHVFTFINKGTTPLVINRAAAQCGCTTPEWPKAPIEPGKKGTITVTYNPQGRPGMFTKTVTIYSNAEEENYQVVIKGEVIPKQVGEINHVYPLDLNGLLVKNRVIQMGNVEKSKIITHTIDIQNGTKSAIKVSFSNLPSFISYKASPSTLQPNEEGKVVFTFFSNKCKQWGPVSSDIYAVVNAEKKKLKPLVLA